MSSGGISKGFPHLSWWWTMLLGNQETETVSVGNAIVSREEQQNRFGRLLGHRNITMADIKAELDQRSKRFFTDVEWMSFRSTRWCQGQDKTVQDKRMVIENDRNNIKRNAVYTKWLHGEFEGKVAKSGRIHFIQGFLRNLQPKSETSANIGMLMMDKDRLALRPRLVRNTCPELLKVAFGPKDVQGGSSERPFLVQKDLDSANTSERLLPKVIDEVDIFAGRMMSKYLTSGKCCRSYNDVKDTPHFIVMEPSVSMETSIPVYKHSCSSGSFECKVSGLRWVCAGEVTLQYQFSDPDIFRAELAMLQYTPIGPLLDIKVLSGELLEAHLPHFACLEGSDASLKGAVRVLHGVDGGVTLQTCELTRSHAKLIKPSFSMTEVLLKIGIPVKVHVDVLIYRTRVTPLVLLAYVVPRDASMIQAVENDLQGSKEAKKIKKHRPDKSICLNTKCGLQASLADAKISPSEITLKYIKPPDLFKVVIKNKVDCFDMELINEGQSIWKATLEIFEYGEPGDMAVSQKMPSEAYRPPREVIHHNMSYTNQAARFNEEEGDTALMANKDKLFKVRPELIKRTSGALLRDLLDELQAPQTPVISSREAEAVLQGTSVLQDQVTSLIDIMLRKGDKACGVMVSLLKELDLYLYQDLGL